MSEREKKLQMFERFTFICTANNNFKNVSVQICFPYPPVQGRFFRLLGMKSHRDGLAERISMRILRENVYAE